MLDVVIAVADPEDAGEILTLQRAAFLRDAQLYSDPFMSSLTQTVEEVRAEITDPDRIVLKATAGHRIVGSVRGHIVDGTCSIGRLMTAPDLEGQGIGGQLMAAIEERAASLVERYELHTGGKSASNIAMYERRGYRLVGEHEDGSGMAVVNMTKPVDR
jgi:ribosomal protein S18 acetylase RimI-like enzyme